MGQKVYKNINDFLASDEFKGDLFDKAADQYAKDKAAGLVKDEPAPSLWKKGDRVTFINPKYKDQKGWQDEHEILGFYKDGEVVDENTASPYNKGYGVRIKNLKTGQELPIEASYLTKYIKK